MIERVAKALENSTKGGGFATWEEVAKAAIKAMREPNNHMLHACAKSMSPERRPTMARVSVKRKHRIRYQAMIDAALGESDASKPELDQWIRDTAINLMLATEVDEAILLLRRAISDSGLLSSINDGGAK